ncbi:TetR/AcrR family transcriptional regulator [Marinobacter sp. 1Y8]
MTEENPVATVKVSSALKDSIHYNGRKTARAKSENRRVQILEAALEIAAAEGVRGIKHRAVARRAGVPLASTTYYFRDISELIRDAFMLFADKAKEKLDNYHARLNTLIDDAQQQGLLESPDGKCEVAAQVAKFIADYFCEEFRFHQSAVLTEQVFLFEAMREPELHALARQYRQAWYKGVEGVMGRLNTDQPKRDAALIVCLVSGMGYDGVLFRDRFNPAFLEESLGRTLGMLMGVDPGRMVAMVVSQRSAAPSVRHSLANTNTDNRPESEKNI